MSLQECNTIEELLIYSENYFPNLYEYVLDPNRLTEEEVQELNSVFVGALRDAFLVKLYDLGASANRSPEDTELLRKIATSVQRRELDD